MLIVLASRFDTDAACLVKRWRDQGARLLTCADLSLRGWIWEPDSPERASLCLEGQTVQLWAVRGVVSLLSGVGPGELPLIIAEEREYVACEMSAFLLAWLSSVSCYVINRPSSLCLTGPRLYHEQWLQQATRVGLRIRGTNRRLPSFTPPSGVKSGPALQIVTTANSDGLALSVPIIAGRCLCAHTGDVLPEAVRQALQRLATEVGAGLLTASLSQVDDGYVFAGATPTVDVSRAEVADTLLAALKERL